MEKVEARFFYVGAMLELGIGPLPSLSHHLPLSLIIYIFVTYPPGPPTPTIIVLSFAQQYNLS